VTRPTFRPKQTLGQNFLVDENIARKIVGVLTPKPEDIVIEIGPGFGVLTKYILPKVERLTAVEIDRYLFEKVRATFGGAENLDLVLADFLKIDLSSYFEEGRKLRIIGNVPFHITSPVIFKVFAMRQHISDLILMIQKEVADRIVAVPRTKDYGILSVFSQLYSRPAVHFHVSRNVFKPRPNVESSVIRWDFDAARKFDVKDAALLKKIVKASFNQRRKMLRKSLQQLPELEGRLAGIDFNLEKRPEELTVTEFVQLSNLFAG